MIGLLGKKLGMTHVYDEYGRRIAVTALQAGPCTILRIRESSNDGYHAMQIGFDEVKESRLSKPFAGQFKKAGLSPFRFIKEFRLQDKDKGFEVGKKLTVELFKEFELVDVMGKSIGKGFQGGVKRWNWKGGPKTHGSMSHRAPGSIGSTTTPGRVWKGHHLPGHMGSMQVTTQNVRIVRILLDQNILLVEGSVPGSEGSLVSVSKSKKYRDVIKAPAAFQTIVEEEEETSKKAKAKK